ncbi:MAG: AMP-binding protein, partial [Clostridiales bacterium]|nr:AMP-binding protein [Clostridiales bacterium]
MKTSFSTLACPDFTWQEIYSMAKDFGFDGIELRGLGKDIFSVKAPPFRDENIDATVAKLKKLKLEISCLSSGVVVNDPANEAKAVEEVTAYAKLAGKVGASYIRVLGDRDPAPAGEVDDNIVIDIMMKLVSIAEEYNVTLLLETNGVYCDTKRLKKVIDAIGSRKVAALWDMHHPYRFAGESPEETVANLGELIKYTHVKDSVMDGDKVVYKMMGSGDMPIKECFAALDSINYQGFVTLEWVYRWSRDMLDANIVVPQFASYMEAYKPKQKTELQIDNRGTGYYPWPKETLIDLTFPDVLDKICELFPNQYAFRYTELDYTRTYPEFRDDVDNLARAFLAMGCKKGDHIAIWATNVPQWYLTFWAATKIGCVLVTVNTAYKIHEIEYLLRQSDTCTLVMIDKYKDCDYLQIINEICPELATSEPGKLEAARLPVLKNVITCESRVPGCFHWDDLPAMAETVHYSEVEKIRRTVDKHDVCNMQYTSGTTGFPNGVML